MKTKRNSPAALTAGPVVLDSSAVLAYLRQEKGAEMVASCLDGAMLSTVNLSEVLAKTTEHGGNCELARELLVGFHVSFVAFGEGHATLAAELREITRSLGLSLGDRACLALAEQEKLAVVTADRAWSELTLAITVHQIR